ncbi:tetratricopeptide repeat protein 39B [Leptinotarsa decemlineata]|uniref:tetratricopeptide repeat protein 39B n=1 Tax=Leptinotarsa decemlineata TaxID=7539 RepID=UPI003D30C889
MAQPIGAYESESDNEEYEDTQESLPLPADMTLNRALDEANRAVNDFFNNNFEDAKSLMNSYKDVSMYHSLGSAMFLSLEAIMTFEQESIALAVTALKRSLAVSNRFRKKNTIGESIGNAVRGTQYAQYTTMEAHAELCYAESLMLRAVLTFAGDETLTGIIKGGIRMRNCFNAFKDCQEILLKKNWDGDSTKNHFESGVKAGIGSFNLMISLMPAKVTKLLELIGFSGNRQLGLRELDAGAKSEGMRQILSVMVTLAYNLIVLHVLGHREGDMRTCRDIIQNQLEKHPDSVWFSFFMGRLEFVSGNLDAGQEWYSKSWNSQNIWPQFHQVCYWELFWVHCMKTEWRQAIVYCDKLIENSKWSRSLYSYLKAAVLLMIDDDLTLSEVEEVNRLMGDVTKHKQRIAGKSLPMEKLAVKRAERYLTQKGGLVIPIIEMMYLWNIFKVLKKPLVATNILKIIEKALKTVNIKSKNSPSEYDNDNKAVVLLAKGTCLRYMGSPLQGLECLENVISMKKSLVEDHYVVPYAIVELALIEWQNGKKELAIAALEDVKKNFAGYAMEARLQFRIHSALSDFKSDNILC